MNLGVSLPSRLLRRRIGRFSDTAPKVTRTRNSATYAPGNTRFTEEKWDRADLLQRSQLSLTAFRFPEQYLSNCLRCGQDIYYAIRPSYRGTSCIWKTGGGARGANTGSS